MSLRADDCKYCHGQEDEEEGGSFVLPCACRTPLHQRCLFQWLCTKRRNDCEICRERWQGLLQVSADGLLGALEQAQQAQQGEGAAQHAMSAALQSFVDGLNSRQMQLGRMLERQLRQAQLERQQQLEAREQADGTIQELRLALAAERERAAGHLAQLRAVREAVHLAHGVRAVEQALERAYRAEAARDAALEAKMACETEARVAWDEKNKVQVERNEHRRRANRLEVENVNLRAEVERLRGRQALQAQQARHAQQVQQVQQAQRAQHASVESSYSQQQLVGSSLLAGIAGVLATLVLGPLFKKGQPKQQPRKKAGRSKAGAKSSKRAWSPTG